MYDSQTGHAVRETLDGIVSGHEPPTPADRKQLRVRLAAAVDELKSMGWPIEHIIVRLKQLLAEAGFPGNSLDSLDRDKLRAELVGWCIDRYFLDGSRSGD